MAEIRRQNAPRRLQDAHKTAQEALRPPPRRLQTPQDASKTSPRRPKTTPRRPKTPPRQPKSHKSTQNQNLIDFSSDPGRYPIGRSDGVPPPALNFQCPTCLLKLTFQKGNYLKKDENFAKEHIQIILHTRAWCGRCRRHLDINIIYNS